MGCEKMKVKKNILLEEENGEAILFDRESLLTAWLNETSILVWKDLKQGKNLNEMIFHFQTLYDGLSQEEAEKDIQWILDTFHQYGFVENP